MKTSDDASNLPSRSTGGLALSYTSNTPFICIVESYQLTPLAIGTCRITIRQPGNAAFSAAIAVNKSLQIVSSSSAPPISETSTSTVAPSAGSATTTVPSSTSTVAPSAGSAATTVPIVAMASSPSSSAKAPTITTSRSTTAKSIASAAKLAVLSTSKVSLKVVSAYAKYCKVSGATVKGLKTGSCKVIVTVKPKKGKAISKTVTLKVSK